jgi:hypothetical protein
MSDEEKEAVLAVVEKYHEYLRKPRDVDESVIFALWSDLSQCLPVNDPADVN